MKKYHTQGVGVINPIMTWLGTLVMSVGTPTFRKIVFVSIVWMKLTMINTKIQWILSFR